MSIYQEWDTGEFSKTRVIDFTHHPFYPVPTLRIEKVDVVFASHSMEIELEEAKKLKKVLEAFIDTYST